MKGRIFINVEELEDEEQKIDIQTNITLNEEEKIMLLHALGTSLDMDQNSIIIAAMTYSKQFEDYEGISHTREKGAN